MKIQILLITISALITISCEKEHNNEILVKNIVLDNGIHATYDITYDKVNNKQLDIFYRPNKATKKPVLIFVYGGGWVSGNKNNWERNHIDFSDNIGFISVVPNYTLNDYSGKAKHPVMVNDIAQSIRWVYHNIEQYGGDRHKIYLAGGSAGALLVSLIGTDQRILERVGLSLTNIKGVISIDGGAYMTLDPIEYLLPKEGTPLYEPLKGLKLAYQSVFGYSEQENIDACPYFHIEKDKGIPPFLFISQDKEIIYRYKPNKMMSDKLNKNNIRSTHHIAHGYEHAEIFKCIGTTRDSVKIGSSIKEFLLQ